MENSQMSCKIRREMLNNFNAHNGKRDQLDRVVTCLNTSCLVVSCRIVSWVLCLMQTSLIVSHANQI